MDVLGDMGLMAFVFDLPSSAPLILQNVFGTFAGVLVGAIILTLTIYFIRKILNGANKGKARLR